MSHLDRLLLPAETSSTSVCGLSYAALGLAASLTPTASGGMERALVGGERTGSTPSSKEVEQTPEASVENAAGPSGLRKGFGRIVRDENGNVVDIELPEDGQDEIPSVERLVEEQISDVTKQASLAGWVNPGGVSRDGSAVSSTYVVQSKFCIHGDQSLLCSS
jgi:nucleolar protein 16